MAVAAVPGVYATAGAELELGVPTDARGPAADPLSLIPPNLRTVVPEPGVAAAGLAIVGVVAAAAGLGAAGVDAGRAAARGAVLGVEAAAPTSCCTPRTMAIACCFRLAAPAGVLAALLPWPFNLRPSPSFGPLLGVVAARGAGDGVEAAGAGDVWPWPLSFRKPDFGAPPADTVARGAAV